MSDAGWLQVMESLTVGVLVLDGVGRVCGHNTSASMLLDGDDASKSLLGQSYSDLLYESSDVPESCPVARALRVGQRQSGHVQRGERGLEVTAHPLVSESADAPHPGALCILAESSTSTSTSTSTSVASVALPLPEGTLFRDFFESANVGKALTLPTAVVEVNEAMARMLGFSATELSGRTWRELTHPSDYEHCEQIFASMLEGGASERRFIKRYLHRDGGAVWADVHAVLRHDGHGRPLYFITTAVDISEQKRVEQQLRASEERFEKAFMASPAGMTITRIADGRFVDVNEAFVAMLGFARDEVLGKTSIEMGIWSRVERDDVIRRQLATGGLMLTEIQVTARDGRRIDLLFSSQPIVLGGAEHHVTTMIDISERRQAERDLASSEQRYRALFENMNAGFILFEVVTGDDGRPVDLTIRAGNRLFEQTIGLVMEEVLGRRLKDVLPGIEDDPVDWIGTYGAIALGGEPRIFEARSARLGRHFSINAYQSSPAHCAVTYSDISEMKRMRSEKSQLERQLQQAQKLESIGRLAGGVAHDFNNLLSVILGYSEFLLESLPDEDARGADVREIIQAGRRSAALTRQLLSFSRSQALRPEVLDVNDALVEARRMLGRVIGEDIEFSLELQRSAGFIKVDPGQLQQVIVNLVVNARDAMPEGGRLVIEVVDLPVDEALASQHPDIEPGRHTLLTVSDSGGGMSKEVMDRVFEPFFTTKGIGEGTGLGLSTVYGIVKQSGGAVWVDSEQGRGTVFSICFPVAAGSLTPASPEPRASNDGDGQQILIVEDEESVRTLIAKVLPRIGYTVHVASSGSEAISMVEQRGLVPDLVLTDVVMPNTDGQELVERLRRRLPGLKCLLMSGHADRSLVRGPVLDPDTPFLSKPFATTELAASIREALGRA